MCMEHSAGCMLFDLSYLVKDNWWKYANAVEYSQMKPGDQADVAEICKEIFAPEYFVTPENCGVICLKILNLTCPQVFACAMWKIMY